MIFFSLEILLIKGGDRVSEFSCKTKIISGAGSIKKLSSLGSKKLLMVAGPNHMRINSVVL